MRHQQLDVYPQVILPEKMPSSTLILGLVMAAQGAIWLVIGLGIGFFIWG